MPFFNVVGCTNLNTTFEVGMIFLAAEKEEDYAWGLNAMARTFRKHDIQPPKVALTDREKAIMTALKTTFPDAANIICRWHINKNIVKNCKSSRYERRGLEASISCNHGRLGGSNGGRFRR